MTKICIISLVADFDHRDKKDNSKDKHKAHQKMYDAVSAYDWLTNDLKAYYGKNYPRACVKMHISKRSRAHYCASVALKPQ